MANIKAEVLADILADAKTAKNIKGKPNIYSPEEYNKIAARERAMGLVSDEEYLVSHIEPGSVEFDANHRLKKVGRNTPKMLDLSAYTANRYTVEKVAPMNEKKLGRKAGTYIILVLGNAIVTAINNTQELPPTVKAYRFMRVEHEIIIGSEGEKTAAATVSLDDVENDNVEKKAEEVAGLEKKTIIEWDYCGAEFIKSDDAYKMVNQLDPESVLKLRAKIDDSPNPRRSDKVYGDSLDEIK